MTQSFVVLMIRNSKSDHLGAQGVFQPMMYFSASVLFLGAPEYPLLRPDERGLTQSFVVLMIGHSRVESCGRTGRLYVGLFLSAAVCVGVMSGWDALWPLA